MTSSWSTARIVVSLPDLLHHVGCNDIEEFSAGVHGDTDVDTWVDAAPDGLEVRTTAAAIVLPYPFTMGQFWAVVAELEQNYLRRSAVDEPTAIGFEAVPSSEGTTNTGGHAAVDDVVDGELAELLGVDRDALALVLGGGWRSGLAFWDGSGDEKWFLSGEPAQVAVGRVGPEFVLARPTPSWSGVVDLVWHFEDRRPFHASDVLGQPEVLKRTADELAARRRRTFRWCRTCRELQAPEWYLREEGHCMGCASQYHGHVF